MINISIPKNLEKLVQAAVDGPDSSIHIYITPSYQNALYGVWPLLRAFARLDGAKAYKQSFTLELSRGQKVRIVPVSSPEALRGLRFSTVVIDEAVTDSKYLDEVKLTLRPLLHG